MSETEAVSAFFDGCVHRAASPLSEFLARRCSEAVVDACELVEDGDCSLLDFGCGIGLLSRQLAPYCSRIIGIDASLEAVRAFNAAVRIRSFCTSEHGSAPTKALLRRRCALCTSAMCLRRRL